MFTSLAIGSVFDYITDKLSSLPILKITTNTGRDIAFTYDNDLDDSRFREKYVKSDYDLSNYIHFIWSRGSIQPFNLKPVRVQKWTKAYAKDNSILDIPTGKIKLVTCNLDIRPISNSLLLLETFEELASIYLYDSFSTTFTATIDNTDFEFVVSGTIQDLSKYEKSDKFVKQYKEQFTCSLVYPIVLIDEIGKVVTEINKYVDIYVDGEWYSEE